MPQAKKKSKLTEITFDHPGAHVALCKEEQGFSANGKPKALIVKSLEPIVLQKIQQIKVVMELPEFLQKFFSLYYDDAWTLAKLLGYEADPEDNVYDQWLNEKVESFEILKSLKDSANIKKDFDALDDESKLAVLTDQFLLEKTISDYELEKSKTKPTKEGKDVPVKKELDADDLQKALDLKEAEAAKATLEKAAMQADLQKALDVIKAFEEEKKAAITKSKVDKIEAIVKSVDDKAIFVKAALALDSDEDFTKFTTTLEAVYKEVGVSGVDKAAKVEKQDDSVMKHLLKKHKVEGNK
jgi:hypothetical protein